MISIKLLRNLSRHSLKARTFQLPVHQHCKRLFTNKSLFFNESIKFTPNNKQEQAKATTSEQNTVKVNVNKPTAVGKVPQQSLISFTCKKCKTRSTHVISKQAYTKGTILIECPGCKNRHLIADHLNIFSDSRVTIEDILKAKGESIAYGDTNDIEFDKLPESIRKKLGLSTGSSEVERK